MENECMTWLNELREIFTKLDNKIILADYQKTAKNSLGFVKAKIEQKLDFDPESLILGKNYKIKKRRNKPKEFHICINNKLQEIKNPELRREIVQFVMIHELSHIEQEDLLTLSKQYSKRKKKRIHVNDFKNQIFEKYNKLRELKDLPKIKERRHLDIAIAKILESINFHGKS